MQLSDAIRQFLEYCEVERARSPATIRMYAFVLDRFAVFAETKHARTTDAITLDLVRAFRLWLHRRPGRKDTAITPGTQNLHLVILRAFLKYLAKRDIPSLPAEKIELARQPDREVEFLEPEEVERLLKAPIQRARPKDLVPLRDKAILEVLFSTGMRVGELIGLTRDDVRIDRDEFAVRGKGGKVRVVFLSPDARQWLRKYLEARGDMHPHLFIRHDRAAGGKGMPHRMSRRSEATGAHPVWSMPEEPAGPLTARSVERLVARYARAAGIVKPVHPHTLRHSYATDLLRGGASIRDVQAMLGHSSITTTQIYTHVTEQHLREAHQKFHRRKR